MDFTRRLRPGVLRGDITCSIRIWQSPRVKAGKRYECTGIGQIEIDSIREIALSDITPALARESGFDGVVDLLKIAKHGSGRNVYLVRFHHVAAGKANAVTRKPANGERHRKRIATMVAKLPEGATRLAGRHMSLEVRGKRFGWFLDDHHGDGRVALNCKGSAALLDMLQNLAPEHYHVPKYVRGWVGLWLDLPKLDWSLVETAVREAYALAAPKKLLAQAPSRSR
jgi:hypothetical protein